jgi:multiple sugar transport system substrate-binding protein
MEEIELSIMLHSPDPAGDLQPLLDQFCARHRCRVRVKVLSWDTGWVDLVKVALYRHGPDVSEIGTGWVSNLMVMNALRPFRRLELDGIGGPSAFLDSAWRSGWVAGDKQPWAVPWLADTRVIHYRRDLLAKAGINEETAFQSQQQLEETLERLQASGTVSPWVVTTQYARNTLHNVASWVWGAGGNFISADGKRTLFSQAESRSGIRAYFGLHRYLSSPARNLTILQSESLYQQGGAAATICGPWLVLRDVKEQPVAAEVAANTGVTLPPGVPWVGGSNLVIWKHSLHEKLAVELVRFLTSPPVQYNYSQRAGLLPVRLDVLNDSPFADHPLYRVMSEGARTGRSFPSFSAWGLVEDCLATELTNLWTKVLADPQLDLDVAINERLDPLARGLSLTLAQTL